MKWLTLITCLLASSLAVAQETPTQPPLPPGAVILPLVTLCSEIDPAPGLESTHGEIGFLEGAASIYIPGGKTIDGKLEFYLSPDEKRSFTMMFVVGELKCMIMSGINIMPITSGERL